MFKQFLVLLAGFVVLELVLLEFLDLAGGVLGQPVDLFLLALESLSEGLLEAVHFVFGQRRGLLLLAALLARILFAPLTRFAGAPPVGGSKVLLLVCRLLRFWSWADFVEAVVEGVSLHVEDFVELALDVVEDGGEVEAFELLASLLAESLEQVAHAVGAFTVGSADAALHHVAQRLLEVAEGEQVVGEGLEDVVGVEGGDVLRAIPLRVSESGGHGHILQVRSRWSKSTPLLVGATLVVALPIPSLASRLDWQTRATTRVAPTSVGTALGAVEDAASDDVLVEALVEVQAFKEELDGGGE